MTDEVSSGLTLGELDCEEISEDEFKTGGSRNAGSWKAEAIKHFAEQLVEECAGKAIKLPIKEFYSKFREDAGKEVVKYASYYSRKVLVEAFDSISAVAKVKTQDTKNSSTQGVMKISIQGKAKVDEDEDTEE